MTALIAVWELRVWWEFLEMDAITEWFQKERSAEQWTKLKLPTDMGNSLPFYPFWGPGGKVLGYAEQRNVWAWWELFIHRWEGQNQVPILDQLPPCPWLEDHFFPQTSALWCITHLLRAMFLKSYLFVGLRYICIYIFEWWSDLGTKHFHSNRFHP